MRALASHALDELRHGNTPAETALGLVLFLCLYLLGWLKAFEEAAAAAVASRVEPVNVFGIVWSLATSLTSVWLMVLVLAACLLLLDKVLVASLARGGGGDGVVPTALRIAFAWCINPHVQLALAASLALTLGVAAVWMKWLGLRRAPPAERARAVRHVLAFNLVLVGVLVGGQAWLDAQWNRA